MLRLIWQAIRILLIAVTIFFVVTLLASFAIKLGLWRPDWVHALPRNMRL